MQPAASKTNGDIHTLKYQFAAKGGGGGMLPGLHEEHTNAVSVTLVEAVLVSV